MTSPSAVPPIAAAAGDQPATASDSEEYEYEEIEVEEEVEVEEFVTDDDNEDKLASKDEKSPQCGDGIMTVETANPINECSKQVPATDKVLHSEEQTAQQQKESKCTDFSMKTCRHDQSVVPAGKPTLISNDEKSSQYDGGIVTAETANPINECSKQVTASDKVDKVPLSEEHTTQVKTEDFEDVQQTESRLDVDVTLIRPRSLSPAMEINKGNKRLAIGCKFFALGWCINGSSCRFLHVKDGTDAGAIQNKTQKSVEGVSDGTQSYMSIDVDKVNPPVKMTGSSNDVDKVNPPAKADSSQHGPLSNPSKDLPKKEEFGGKEYRFALNNHVYIPSYNSSVLPRTTSKLSSSPWKSDSKFSSYDWEASKPFRSAFLISKGISSPDIQFDPIVTSTDPPPKNGDKLSKLSPSVKEKLKTENGSIGSHVNGNNGINVDSNEAAGAKTKQETKNSESKGKDHPGDVVQASKVHFSSHDSLGGPTKEVNNHKLVFDVGGDMHRESKPVRHFRAALVEFVKELVKPTWRDGKLSKDAHKLIVKKAVDKVLTTLPPEHIPSVKESIDMYLTSSQTKLMNLVEAYIAKYGKI
ncbi:protein FRIGIDA-ESSENTIAL 1 isoform X1 [Helianthus annuus]|uniref:protein FRIGIDA-ESSENTIAL 1 isoform X1 n=1 Tax=Helianthus annuus TaxID=4232 RepID=UPI000B901749|nr:protein FRIGIDA-ESSENTIAL 1 isoform X1 [Helianthus annuus]XP_022012275.1 protein FRIGIDA-ESSENTIAL 1 isoform X1 [Helianthus annuus]XP_022012276.1 protein FRIGIDA-ESSENTIAL 1 isoform X1 [Helianthus annuus]XP_022012277.1 protein FRIGIDA-ESSENTIAL 1 isoform X1 [Helianthus annuus]XP_035839773.1 protein FRIGIDA-ESSENTIAL 1 isoform X1 [Helianthus annuus]XP_035839774.1 protein FRIGIDA-ESSENTIAL 1 isoform X1 [Helianthus annuus]XP_035839775.1 protein FRIGIDA-ESSENTIAL 1 isoform X1 [Helianthus annuu